MMIINPFKPLVYPSEHFDSHDISPLLLWCIAHRVSDITIQTDEPIICEIYGKKHHVTTKRLSTPEVSNIMVSLHSTGIISTINAGQVLDFAWRYKENRILSHRFRVNVKSILVAGSQGYSISIRIIDEKAPLIDTLHLPLDMLEAFTSKSGLIIVSGITGSGKSTTLASVISYRLGHPESHIKVSTFESPIEATYDHIDKPTSSISQMEVGVHIASFAEGVRNSVRTRSDVVLVGESRDYATISAVIDAAMVGPLVYTTTHTKNASEVIARFINVFSENEKKARLIDLIDNLEMIVTQKLIPAAHGGRVAIHEYIIFNQDIKDLLIESELEKVTYVMRRVMAQYGRTFLQDLTDKLKQNIITEQTFNMIKKELR